MRKLLPIKYSLSWCPYPPYKSNRYLLRQFIKPVAMVTAVTTAVIIIIFLSSITLVPPPVSSITAPQTTPTPTPTLTPTPSVTLQAKPKPTPSPTPFMFGSHDNSPEPPGASKGYLEGAVQVSYPLVSPVTIDGKWSNNTEWADTGQAYIDEASFFSEKWVKSGNSSFEYILIETNNTVFLPSDSVELCFDGIANGGQEPQGDDYRVTVSWDANVSWARGAQGNWTKMDTPPPNIFQWNCSVDSSPTNQAPHWIYEFRIDKNQFIINDYFGLTLTVQSENDTKSWPPLHWGYIKHYTSPAQNPAPLPVPTLKVVVHYSIDHQMPYFEAAHIYANTSGISNWTKKIEPSALTQYTYNSTVGKIIGNNFGSWEKYFDSDELGLSCIYVFVSDVKESNFTFHSEPEHKSITSVYVPSDRAAAQLSQIPNTGIFVSSVVPVVGMVVDEAGLQAVAENPYVYWIIITPGPFVKPPY